MKSWFHSRVRVLAAFSLILVGVLVQGGGLQAYCHSEFHKYFEGLGMAEARVSPVERFVFSLLLTKTRPEPQPAGVRTVEPHKPL
jgi:hypothetical protein